MQSAHNDYGRVLNADPRGGGESKEPVPFAMRFLEKLPGTTLLAGGNQTYQGSTNASSGETGDYEWDS